MINRRGLITGLISLAAAPAIVRVENLMPIKVIRKPFTEDELIAIWKKMISTMIDEMSLITHDIVMHGSSVNRIEYAQNTIDGVVPPAIHNLLKLDQSISSKRVDAIKITRINKLEM